MFLRYSLRTLDVEGARAFYRGVIGLDFSTPAECTGLEIWPLHERARALGAPAHWLGQLAVDDVEATATRLEAIGAQRLGPTVVRPDGSTYATLRDPLGGIVAIRGRASAPTQSPVAWHHLHTTDVERSSAIYGEHFGMRVLETLDAPGIEGGVRTFAWGDSDKAVGSIANTARSEGVHPHWLVYFAVPNLDSAIARVLDLGGKALPPVALPDGHRLAGCDDPQGAAFGLIA